MANFCQQCGKENSDEARFCSACGRPMAAGSYAQGPPSARGGFRTLVRPRAGRKIAGVCQGLADHYGWDVTVVRVVMVLLATLGFPIGLVIYGLMWLVAPEEPLALPASTYVNPS